MISDSIEASGHVTHWWKHPVRLGLLHVRAVAARVRSGCRRKIRTDTRRSIQLELGCNRGYLSRNYYSRICSHHFYIYIYVCVCACVWYEMTWYDMKWHDIIWHDMIWYDIWYTDVYGLHAYMQVCKWRCVCVCAYIYVRMLWLSCLGGPTQPWFRSTSWVRRPSEQYSEWQQVPWDWPKYEEIHPRMWE